VAGRAHRSSRISARRPAGELEAEVLATLWATDEPITTAGVRQAIGRGLAYNTVQTVLVRLYEKGLVGRVADGRRHTYFPVKQSEELAAEQMQALLSRGPDRQAVLQRFASSLPIEDARALMAILRRLR
jgi:predicted transcriptional regulator